MARTFRRSESIIIHPTEHGRLRPTCGLCKVETRGGKHVADQFGRECKSIPLTAFNAFAAKTARMYRELAGKQKVRPM